MDGKHCSIFCTQVSKQNKEIKKNTQTNRQTKQTQTMRKQPCVSTQQQVATKREDLNVQFMSSW